MSDEPQTFNLYLEDQIPRFRSGLRTITVVQIGPKWVRLRCGTKVARIPRARWVTLIASNATMHNRNANPVHRNPRR